MTDWNITFNEVVNQASGLACKLSEGDLIHWCKVQYIAHSYIYMPLIYWAFFLMGLAYNLQKFNTVEIMKQRGYKHDVSGLIIILYESGLILLSFFILIFLLQNDIRPMSWLPLAWKIWLKGVLGI